MIKDDKYFMIYYISQFVFSGIMNEKLIYKDQLFKLAKNCKTLFRKDVKTTEFTKVEMIRLNKLFKVIYKEYKENATNLLNYMLQHHNHKKPEVDLFNIIMAKRLNMAE